MRLVGNQTKEVHVGQPGWGGEGGPEEGMEWQCNKSTIVGERRRWHARSISRLHPAQKLLIFSMPRMWNKEPFIGYASKQVEFDMNVGEGEHEKWARGSSPTLRHRSVHYRITCHVNTLTVDTYTLDNVFQRHVNTLWIVVPLTIYSQVNKSLVRSQHTLSYIARAGNIF